MKRPFPLCVALLLPSVVAAAPEPVEPDVPLEPGLSLRVYDLGENLSRLPELVAGQTGNVNKRIDTVALGNDDFGVEDQFYAEVTGFIVIEIPGEYEFELRSDDGSALEIGGELVLDHDGLHSGDVPMDDLVTLEAGTYPIRLRHFDNTVDASLTLSWRVPGGDGFVPVPADVLFTEANQVRVTSPGRKQFEVPDGPSEVARGAGDRAPLDAPHPATELVDLRPDGFEPKVGGMDFLPDGRLVLCTWDPRGDVFVIDNVTGDGSAETAEVTRFATGLAEPLGLKVMDGRVFVLQKQELTELVDHDDDGVADEYRAAVTGWPVSDNFHEFAFGLEERDGKLIALLALAINPGGATTNPQVPGRGTALALDPDAGTYEVIAAGLRTPNGLAKGVDGELFVYDNQGDWLPCSKIVHLQDGAFYNSHITPPHPLSEEPVTPPAVWLPQGEIGNSPTSGVLIPESWGPYAGQMLHGDVTHGGVKRVFMEQVDGHYQGAAFRFGQGMEAGTNRMIIGPDEQLYVGGVGSNGNWQHAAAPHWFGLQKLRFSAGNEPFEMLEVRPGTGGVEIVFTKPLAEGDVSPRSVRLRTFRYEPTATYGGPKLDERRVSATAATVSDDRRRLWLELPDGALRPDHVLYVTLRDRGDDALRGVGDEPAWTTEAWYTMTNVPDRRPDYAGDRPEAETDAEGFVTLFGDAADLADNWRGFKRDDVPGKWSAADGELVFDPAADGDGGDLVTVQTFGDFDLRLEWNVAEGGNSGVMYRVAESGDNTSHTFTTGPEMQVLDDERHPDADNGRDRRAGALNGLVAAPEPSPVRPAGRWNEARIVAEGTRLRHYLNGELIVDVDTDSDDWRRRLAASKFADWPRFAREPSGHLALQDHGDRVRFRNIRLKPLGH